MRYSDILFKIFSYILIFITFITSIALFMQGNIMGGSLMLLAVISNIYIWFVLKEPIHKHNFLIE